MSIAPPKRMFRIGLTRGRPQPHACARMACVGLEQLEARVLLSPLDPIPLAFGTAATHAAHASADLANPNDVVYFQLPSLSANDLVTAAVNTAPYGGALNSYMTVYQGAITASDIIASNDNFHGLDAGLTFQAAQSGVPYYLAISGVGSSRGLFDLNILDTPAATATPMLTVSSFQVSVDGTPQSTAQWGDTVTIDYTLQNRGAAAVAPGAGRAVAVAFQRQPLRRRLHRVGRRHPGGTGPGASVSGSISATLAKPDSSFQDGQQIFLGLGIGAATPKSPEAGNDWASVQMLAPVAAVPENANNTLQSAEPIPLNSQVNGVALAGSDEDFYQITLTQPGNVTAQVAANGAPVALALYDATGVPIVQSNGQSPTQAGPLIAQGLSAGTYVLKVANLTGQAADYTLTTLFAASASTLNAINSQGQADLVVGGDFNGDGVPDLAVGNVNNDTITILLGNGDGTFHVGQVIPVDCEPQALVVGDFTGDGRLDLAASSALADDVTILLGNGDGAFTASSVPGVSGDSLAVADFSGDGTLDLAVGNSQANTVTILQGDGAGGFTIGTITSVPGGPSALAAADFTGDGLPDLAVAVRDTDPGAVALLVNQGAGVFAGTPTSFFNVGQAPVALAAGDFSGDTNANADLAVADLGSGDVTILLGDGHGSFTTGQIIPLGSDPAAIVTADFNNDGKIDLATANRFSGDVTVLLGNGAGNFQIAGTVSAPGNPTSLAAADFTGAGTVDLAVADNDSFANSVTVLLGKGDGTFTHAAALNATGFEPGAMVEGDFTGDGQLDLAVVSYNGNYDFGTVTILLGQGDGTFATGGIYDVGAGPVAIVAGDFNDDGRLDLATADRDGYEVTVLLGKGDGTFLPGQSFLVGGAPSAIAAGDFTGSGSLDLAVSLELDLSGNFDNQVAILPGDGHGAFGAPLDFTAGNPGAAPVALVAGAFTGDGRLDMAVANYSDQSVTVLMQPPGGFAADTVPAVVTDPVPIGNPYTLAAGAFGGNGRLDLVVGVLNPTGSADLAVFLNDGTGDFPADLSTTYDLNGVTLKSLVTGDFNGNLDLVGADYVSTSLTVLLGNGAGGFGPPATINLPDEAGALAAGDFTGDGNLDIASAGYNTAQVTTILGDGRGNFTVPPIIAPNPAQSTPLVAPLTGPQLDSVVLAQDGDMLFRRGLADEPGAFAAPVVLNPDPADAARALALVQTGNGQTLLAALNAASFSVTFYQPHADGAFTTLPPLALPGGNTGGSIAAADLTNDGLDDLVISAADSDLIFVVLQTSPGVFAAPQVYSVGMIPSAIAFADVNGDGFRDIVVSDWFSGQVSVLINQQNGLFDSEECFNAGAGLHGITSINGATTVQSNEQTVGVVAVGPDLVALNAGTQSFTVLFGDGLGGFLDPQPGQTYAMAGTPTAIVAADFNGDGNLDLAILCADTDTIAIYLGDGRGDFQLTATLDAGNQPTGLSVADVTQPGGGGPDGIPDLLVGNAYGDLLILAGRGNGQFQQYVRADQQVALAVTPGAGTHAAAFYFSDAANDQLAYASASLGAATVAGKTVFADRSAGIQAPGKQTVVTVQGTQYLVVLDSGANELLIYTIGPDGLPITDSDQTYYTGTDPVGLTVTSAANDLSGDGIPDVVVANYGSNDVSVFLGQLVDGAWSLAYRPRQSSGGIGPTSVAVADVTGADVPDLLVANSQSSSVSLLEGRGDGFFVNTAESFATGADPQEIFVGAFGAGGGGLDLISIDADSDDVTFIANLLNNPTVFTISSGGTDPDAAVLTQINGANVLLVANAGNGVLEMLSVSGHGLEAIGSFSQPDAAHLSGLALLAAGNQLDVYGTLAGREVAVLLGTFGLDAIPFGALPPSPGFPAGLEIVFLADTAADFANIDVAFTFSVPAGTNVDVVAPVQIAFNAPGNNPFPDGSSTGGVDLGGVRSSGASSSAPGNPSSILLLNLDDLPAPNPGPNIFEPREEEEELLEELVLHAEQAPALATPDAAVPPISLRRSDAQQVERILIELEPRLRVEAVEVPCAHKSALGILALPVLMAQLAERLRPSLARVRFALRELWKSHGT